MAGLIMPATVISAIDYGHNRHEAASQDYELAKANYLAVCRAMDSLRDQSMERLRAACDRRRRAWECYLSQ